MSLINKMLQELDKRHAVDDGGKPAIPANAKTLAQQLRPVKVRRDFGEAFWRVMAGLMLVVVCWIAWLLWQITPRPVVTELAFQAKGTLRTEAPAQVAEAPAQLPQAQVVVVEPAPASNLAVAAPTAVAPSIAVTPMEKASAAVNPALALAPAGPVVPVAPPVGAAGKPSDPAKIDMLKLATEITTPIPERRARLAAPKTEQKARAISPTDAKTLAAVAAVAPVAPVASPQPQPPVPAARTAATAAASKAPAGDGKIERRNNASARDRADTEFRRAMAFVNQGRIAEAMESLHSTLAIDPAHEAARQTAVGRQLESRRVDEALHLLQDGLALNPAQTGFAMLLARIQVERGDLNGALATLQKHGSAAAANADYLAFSAAILQRLSRHKEAADVYQAVLRLQPGSGVWWMGLGISLQAQKQPGEAAEAFKRARSVGTLSPELAVFVDQRIKQLQ